LLGQIVDDFDDLSDVVGTLSEGSNDFARRIDGGVDTGETRRWAFSMVAMPLWTSSRERLEISSSTLAVSATR